MKTIAICGAGIAGVATAYYLLQQRSDVQVIIIDKYLPLSFTTSKSGENFRDYWPQRCMRQLVSHSILLMEELREKHGNDAFEMTYSGYHFLSHDKEKSIFGINREELGKNQIEEITDNSIIQQVYPHLDKNIQKVVRIKKAGKIDVYALGSLMLREARKLGLKVLKGEITAINNEKSIQIVLNSQEVIQVDKMVIAAGPFINHLAKLVGLNFPVTNTLQRKFMMPDPENVLPKDLPFTIYTDAQYLDWSSEEKSFFNSDENYKWLLNKFPGGLHIKADGDKFKFAWAFQTEEVTPDWEIPPFDYFPQVVLKGASRFIPALAKYENNIPIPLIEYGGYYTRTKENWPLIGPTTLQNVYVLGALAGYGTMAACAAGKLCSDYIMSKTVLPDYAVYFHPNRYQNEDIVKEIEALNSDGQL